MSRNERRGAESLFDLGLVQILAGGDKHLPYRTNKLGCRRYIFWKRRRSENICVHTI